MKPLTIHTVKTQFIIGTIQRTKDIDSHAYNGKWCVNPVNMWVATLGERLTVDNAMLGHLVIVIHEITHTMTNASHLCWDATIVRVLREVMGMKNVKVWESEEVKK